MTDLDFLVMFDDATSVKLTSIDTFTWSQKTGVITHDQSGLTLEFVQPNGADNSFVVLHDPGRTGITTNNPWIVEYAFDLN